MSDRLKFYTVKDITYEPQAHVPGTGCEHCVAKDDRTLCRRLPDCTGVTWMVAQSPDAPDKVPENKKVYIIGSLRSTRSADLANYLREQVTGVEFFDDWQAAGPVADDAWRDYEKARGRTFKEALSGHAAKHVFGFDKAHLDSSDACILCLPAGKSAHLEAGYMIGRGVPTFIFLDDTVDRWDVMYQFANDFDSDPGEVVRWVSETLGVPYQSPYDAG